MEGRGTPQASSQSLPLFEGLLNPLTERRGESAVCMQRMYGCFHLRTQHVLPETSTIVYLPNFSHTHTHTHLLPRPPAAVSELALGPMRGRDYRQEHTHTRARFHLCLSGDAVPAFSRETGLCRAQR